MDSEFFQETHLHFPSHYWKKTRKRYVSASECPKAKDVIPDKQIGPYALGRIIKQVFLCLQNPHGNAFWYHTHWVRLHTQYLIAVFWHKRPQQLPHSFGKYPLSVLFFSLKEGLCLIQLYIFGQGGRTKSCCRKGISPLVFQSHYVITHCIGSDDLLLIPGSERRDQGDPNITSKWLVTSGAQTKSLSLPRGCHRPKSAPQLSLTLAETL